MNIEAMIRAIVREEIADHRATLDAPPRSPRPDPLDVFLSTLAPGEDMLSAELRARFLVWRTGQGIAGPEPSANRFGRMLSRSPRVQWRKAADGSRYHVL